MTRIRLRLCWLLATPMLPLSGAVARSVPPPGDSLLVSAEWLADSLADPHLVVLQLGRDSSAYLAGHIPGARFLPLGAIVTERGGIPAELPDIALLERVLRDAGVSNDSRVVLYGDLLSAMRMFFTLDYLGMAGRVSVLNGGLAAWQAAGHPVTREPPAGSRGSFDARLQPGLLVDAAWVAGHLNDSRVVLLDARSPEEWSGQEAGEGVSRPGHIPGSADVYWRRMLEAREPARFEDGAVLRELLDRAGVSPAKTVVTYCRIGVQSSVVYFVARYLGYEPRLYDGSFVEWSRRTELPVAR
jgi:thiosulfate/3-mercaptopyruvate sulfurtransferase